MTGSSPDHTRPYRSQIRAQQAGDTRRRILDAAVKLMASKPTAWSVPAVADEAGVSVPTVYRHFGDRAGLVEAVVPHVGERLGFQPRTMPVDLDDMSGMVRELFDHYNRADPLIRAALASGRNPMRAESVDVRMGLLREFFGRLEPDLPADVIDQVAKVTVILTCSEALRLWQDRFDLSVDDVADHVAAAIGAMVAGSSR